MKRSRDEMNSSHKRAMVPSRTEPSSTQPQTTVESSSQKLTTNDALQYLKDVKDNFRTSPHKYDEFLEVMKDFKAQRIQTEGVIARVKELFEGNRYLTLGFNNFLPKDYQITLPEEVPKQQPKKPVEFEEAISFVNKIKTRFQGDDRVYKAFLEILNMYRKDNKAISDVYQEVSALLSDHPDLLSEFRHFLPDSSSAALPTNNKNSLVRRDENLTMLGARQFHGEKNLIASHAERDRSVDRPDVGIDRARAGKRRADRDIERENREREYADRDFDHNGQHISQKRKSSAVVEEYVGEQFAKGENSSNGIYSQEFAFCDKVKERFSNSGYEDFIDILEVYNRENFSRSEYEYKVNNFFGKHHDLVEEFTDFFPRILDIDGFLAALRKRSSRSLKIENRNRHSDRERTLKDRGIAFGTGNGSTQRMSLYSNKDKYAFKSIQELDLSNCEQCTPSYRLLPNDYPIPIASQKTEIGAEVLNDYWVSVTSGSEDYSFKHMRKNQYEESLFLCEDDRFELDMLLAQTNSAIKRVEELLKKITDKSVEFNSTFRITDHLTVLNLRIIERIYTDHGLEALDILKKDAPKALPIILSRLKQKQKEGAEARIEYNKVWVDVYAKNHQKSLDHRSFYFKQQDVKSLSTKALVEEIKELREKMINGNDEILLAAYVGNRPPVIPEIEFTYPDPEIHDDLYKLIEYSCGEICLSGELKKVLNTWTSFVEPMLGVPRRALATDDTKVSLEINPNKNENGQEMANRENGVEYGHKDDGISIGNLDNAENASGVVDSSTRQGNAGGLVGLETRLNAENLLSSQGNEGRTSVASTNVITTEATKANEHPNGSVGPLRVEREEGELSPNRDLEEDNFATYGNADVATAQVPNGEVGENDANNEGEGGDLRLIEGSENASVNDDVTGGGESNDNGNNEGCDHDENENKVDSKGEAEVEGEANDDIFGQILPTSQSQFQTAKPIRKRVIRELQQVREKDSRIFYGNDSIYVLLRLHRVLYERIQTVKVNVSERDMYSRFLGALYNLLNGSCDNAKFEDECRSIIGTQSYILFTLDKLIFKIVKQLQAIATDESTRKMFLLHAYENSRRPDTFDEAMYHENACVLLQEENFIYRIECLSSPTRLSIQLLGNSREKPESAFLDQKFLDYLYKDYLSSAPKYKLSSPVFLKRNKCKYPGNEEEQYHAALEGVHMVNGLEIRISSTSNMMQYVLGTEDVLYRPRNKRKNVHQNGSSHDQAKSSNKFLTRAEKFNMWLSGP